MKKRFKHDIYVIPRLEKVGGVLRPMLAIYEPQGRVGHRLTAYTIQEGHSALSRAYYTNNTITPNVEAFKLADDYCMDWACDEAKKVNFTISRRMPLGFGE